MFVNAINRISGFTLPIRFISKLYKSTNIIPGTATMFFINDDGYALTCRHVAEDIVNSQIISDKYSNFIKELNELKVGKNKAASKNYLEKKYGFNPHITSHLKISFDGPDFFDSINIKVSDKYDLALIQFVGYKHINKNGYAIFLDDSTSIQPGKFLCRLGYPFPEFDNYSYDVAKDDIIWTNTGNVSTPYFPIEGMVTRHTAESDGIISGIELSTPGLRGQSGGPLFDQNGIIYGMQSQTFHFHLGFDMKKEKLIINGKEETINNQPFLHVGRCIHVDIIKQFLNDNHIKYYIGNSYDNVQLING